MPVCSEVRARSQHSCVVIAAGTSTPGYLPTHRAATATGYRTGV
jgi:hypothetical protein